MNSQLAPDLVGIQLFAETEGPRIVDPIIESRIPDELRPQQTVVQSFIVSLLPDLCERLLEQVQARRDAGNRPPFPQELPLSRTTDSGFHNEDVVSGGREENERSNRSSSADTSDALRELPQLETTIVGPARHEIQSCEAFNPSDPALLAFLDEERLRRILFPMS